MYPKYLSLIPALSLAAAAHAAAVFSDDFSSYTPGVLTTGAAPANKWASPPAGIIDDNSSLFTRVTTDSGNLFGAGTSNQYLRIADTSNANNTLNYNLAINDTAIGQVGTLAFDFYDPSGDGAQGDGWLLRMGTAAGNSVTAFGLYLMNGELRVATTSNVTPNGTAFGTYSLDTLHSLVIFYNSSASNVSYAGRTLAANTMDVWLDGTIAATALGRSGGTTGVQTIDSFGFTRKTTTNTATDFVGTLYLDNITAYSGAETAAIPEPSAFALAGGAVALTLAGLSRRKRE